MPSIDLSVVSLDSIPTPPYKTPSDNLHAMYSASKSMEVLCADLNGMGLSAAQVGLPWRMFVFRSEDPKDLKFECFFDCEYEPIGDSSSPSVEGCLSLPGQRFVVRRFERIQVRGFELVEGAEGPASEPFSRSYEGIASVLMQHEIDHDLGRERMIDKIGERVSLS